MADLSFTDILTDINKVYIDKYKWYVWLQGVD
jgi:hypothetical protein